MRKISLVAWCLFVLSLCTPASAKIVINEIMYAPSHDFGSTSGYYDNEWVEIYNPEDSDVNITGWVFSEKEKNHTLSGVVPAHGFLILSSLPENFTQYYRF